MYIPAEKFTLCFVRLSNRLLFRTPATWIRHLRGWFYVKPWIHATQGDGSFFLCNIIFSYKQKKTKVFCRVWWKKQEVKRFLIVDSTLQICLQKTFPVIHLKHSCKMYRWVCHVSARIRAIVRIQILIHLFLFYLWYSEYRQSISLILIDVDEQQFTQ